MCHDTESRGMAGGPSEYYNAKVAVDRQSPAMLGSTPARQGSSAFHDAHRTAERAAKQHANATAAIDFFNKHPEFDAFVSLIRSGAIQF